MPKGKIVALLGPNGAGKSTLMRTLFGLTRPVSGQILVDGEQLPHHVPRVLAAHGIALMPEGRGIFPTLTVREIFDLALWSGNIAAAERQKLEVSRAMQYRVQLMKHLTVSNRVPRILCFGD